MKTKIYIPVSVEDELPTKEGRYPVIIAYENRDGFEYFTQAEYSKEYSFHEEMMDCSIITHWLKEIELDIPSDEEIEKCFSVQGYVSIANRNKNEGAKWLREQITNQLKNK